MIIDMQEVWIAICAFLVGMNLTLFIEEMRIRRIRKQHKEEMKTFESLRTTINQLCEDSSEQGKRINTALSKIGKPEAPISWE